MTNYARLSLDDLTELARNANPELTALDNMLIDNHTGKSAAIFQSHAEQDGKATALFHASAREIVLELARRIRDLQARNVREL